MITRGLFVTGTGTDVGKTFASAFILHLLARMGKRGLYYKPIQCGPAILKNQSYPGGDAQIIREVFQLPEAICEHTLAAPVSPHRAFHLEGKSFDAAAFQNRLLTSRKDHDFLLVEGAGGIRVPISDKLEMSDLARLSAFPVLVIAQPGLGTLNHTLLTLEHLMLRRIPVAGFAFSSEQAPTPDGEATVQDNAQTIEIRSGTNFLGFIPPWKGSWPSVPSHPLVQYLKRLF